MSEAVDILMRLRGGRAAASEAKNVGNAIGEVGRRSARSGSEARHAGKAYEYASQRLRIFGHAAIGARERTLGLASAALGLSAGLFGVEHVVRSSVEAWGEQRRTLAQTNAVLKSTGGAAGVTAGEIEHLSSRLSRQTGIQGDQISQAQNMLLTFREVRNEAGKGNDIFNQSTRAAVDMAAAMQSAGKSMSLGDAALQLGKALNDPVKGMTRLQRIGVTFTASQQQQIKTFTAFGDRVSAQRVILRELNKEFGGSAAAVATPGMKLRATIHQLQESFGRGLQPAIDAVDNKLLHLADKAMPYVTKAADDVASVFNRKDLNLGQKLSLAAKVSKRDLTPLFNSIRSSVRQWNPGRRLEDAVSWAIPHLANGFGQAAPKVAWAFVKGFIHANVWGKLATLGFIFWKFSALRSVGTSAASALAGGMVARLAATETGTAIAASLGTGATSTAALATLATIGSKMVKLGLGVGIASEIANLLGTPNADPLLFLHPPPAGGPGDTLPGGPKHKRPPGSKSVDSIVAFYRRHPKQLDASAYESLTKQEQKQLASVYDHTKFHVLPPLPTGRHAKRHTSGFRASGPVPALAGVVRIDNHHHIYIDGQEMTAVLAPNLPNGDNPKWVSAAVGKAVHDRKARR